jgi:hypothetical protein
MIIWGGLATTGSIYVTDNGQSYNPVTNTWQAITLNGAPSARQFHSAVWTGSHMIVWGGGPDCCSSFGDGARYDPVSDSWTPLATADAPRARSNMQAVWDGVGMLVFDGDIAGNNNWNKGGRYISSADADHDGFTACGGDCNDANPAIRPGAAEVCDGVDQDCNAIVDDAPDTDGDGVGACADCAEGNSQVWSTPAEVGNFRAASGAPAAYAWDSLASQAGPQISYDVVTGNFSVAGGFEAGNATCLGSTTATAFSDARPDPAMSAGYWYLVGGRNTCGRGTLGTAQRDAVGLMLCP